MASRCPWVDHSAIAAGQVLQLVSRAALWLRAVTQSVFVWIGQVTQVFVEIVPVGAIEAIGLHWLRRLAQQGNFGSHRLGGYGRNGRRLGGTGHGLGLE